MALYVEAAGSTSGTLYAQFEEISNPKTLNLQLLQGRRRVVVLPFSGYLFPLYEKDVSILKVRMDVYFLSIGNNPDGSTQLYNVASTDFFDVPLPEIVTSGLVSPPTRTGFIA